MKKLIGIALVVVMMSCKDEPSLQKYFVKSGEKKEFMSMDISSSMIGFFNSSHILSLKIIWKSSLISHVLNIALAAQFPSPIIKSFFCK